LKAETATNILRANFQPTTQKPYILEQGFPTYGTRTTSGARRYSRWYASNFHFFHQNWFNSFVVYVSGFVSK